MAYNRTQARALCTASEYSLFEASLADQIKRHAPAQVAAKAARARRMRDKYRDLYKRQRLSTRERTGTKKGDLPARNARTEQKARLFDEVLERFVRRERELEAQAARSRSAPAKKKAAGRRAGARRARKVALPRAARKSQAKSRAVAKRKASRGGSKAAGGSAKAGGGGDFVSAKAAGASRRQTLQKLHSRAIQGHVRASGRRTQARRDSRR
jgi:hypothetical protein